MSRALQEKQALELKLALAERNAQQTLITTQQSHQEQLHTERNRKVCVFVRGVNLWFDSVSVQFIIELI